MEFLKISKFELGGPRRDWETTFFQMPLGVSLASRVNFRDGGFSASPNLQASSPPRPPPPAPAPGSSGQGWGQGRSSWSWRPPSVEGTGVGATWRGEGPRWDPIGREFRSRPFG